MSHRRERQTLKADKKVFFRQLAGRNVLHHLRPTARPPFPLAIRQRKNFVCLPRLPFPSVANNLSFSSLPQPKYHHRLQARQPFPLASRQQKKTSAFIVCLSRLWPIILHKAFHTAPPARADYTGSTPSPCTSAEHCPCPFSAPSPTASPRPTPCHRQPAPDVL